MGLPPLTWLCCFLCLVLLVSLWFCVECREDRTSQTLFSSMQFSSSFKLVVPRNSKICARGRDEDPFETRFVTRSTKDSTRVNCRSCNMEIGRRVVAIANSAAFRHNFLNNTIIRSTTITCHDHGVPNLQDTLPPILLPLSLEVWKIQHLITEWLMP